jgi:flagellar hook-length control protein FliK
MQGLHLQEQALPSPATHSRIETPVGAPGWNTEFAQKIVWIAGEKQQLAELHVNPPDLGALSIKLSISDNQTNAIFTSPHSEVRDAIESALPRLREVLAESGIALGNASVTADSPRDGSAFDQSRQPQPFLADRPGADAAEDPLATPTVIHSRGNALVDLFA